MAINPSEKLRVDTRGLPEDYDPRMFYEYRRETLVKEATGVESFAYKYIPWTYLRSFAFAIDPLGPFKVASHRITPYNRTKYRQVASVLQQRTQRTVVYNYGYSQASNYGGVSICASPLMEVLQEFRTDNTVAIGTQPALPDVLDDTTSRTRLMGSEQGTMRLFKSYLNSPPRTVFKSDIYRYTYHPGPPSPSCSAVGGTNNTRAFSEDTRRTEFRPSAATFSTSNLTSLRNQEYLYLESLISKHAVSMLKEWSPNKRSYSFFRNIVELRDLPRSIVSLQKTLIDARQLYNSLARSTSLRDIVFNVKRTSQDIPSEYLSFHFGWKQLYKDIMELMVLPETLSKKYEFLIKRAGKPTTFRVKKNFTSALNGSLPSFSYDSAANEYNIVHETRLERETELRLVINATFDFPPPNRITFQSHGLFDRMGLVPRPTDLYNLIPWTWLFDWFTGLGSYVELIDNMARDDSLVNWGMITGKTTGKLITNRSSKLDHRTFNVDSVSGTVETVNTLKLSHDSYLHFECQIRKDAAAAMSVKTTCLPDLTAYQASILGALLAQRKDQLTSGAFRPRS